MIHNEIASNVSLAKSILFGLDRSKLETSVPTATLVLLLNALIELGTPSADQKVNDGAIRAIMGHVVAVSEAEKSQQDAWTKEQDVAASMMGQRRAT